MEGETHPSPFASLSFLNSKKVPIHCWVDREGFPIVAWRIPASILRLYGDFLHHNQAALTIRLRPVSALNQHRSTFSMFILICLSFSSRVLFIQFTRFYSFIIIPSAQHFLGNLHSYFRNKTVTDNIYLCLVLFCALVICLCCYMIF